MKTHEFLFGNKLESSVQHIIGQAFQKNTREAYQEAVDKIKGIRTFLVFLSSEGGPELTDALLGINNELVRLFRVIDSPEGRIGFNV